MQLICGMLAFRLILTRIHSADAEVAHMQREDLLGVSVRLRPLLRKVGNAPEVVDTWERKLKEELAGLTAHTYLHVRGLSIGGLFRR